MDELKSLRCNIDAIDNQILNLLAKRLNLASKIAEFKKSNQLPIYDPHRESLKLKDLRNESKLRMLNSDKIENIFKEIIKTTRQDEND